MFSQRLAAMSRQCEVCGKKPVFGNTVSQRGKPKYLGGNGRKTTGISRRTFKPNLQKIRVQDGGSVVTKRVCTRCIRNGKVQKAVVRKPFTLPKS
jgi:large subunit ribosomal protein L28